MRYLVIAAALLLSACALPDYPWQGPQDDIDQCEITVYRDFAPMNDVAQVGDDLGGAEHAAIADCLEARGYPQQ